MTDDENLIEAETEAEEELLDRKVEALHPAAHHQPGDDGERCDRNYDFYDTFFIKLSVHIEGPSL